jgi:tetratricopeptide (TPR) repeat protein
MTGRPAEAAELAATGINAELPREQSRMRTALASALLATGDYQGAIEHSREAGLIAEQHGHRLQQIGALHVLANAREAAGDHTSAQEAHDRAIARSQRLPIEIEQTLRGLVGELELSEED